MSSPLERSIEVLEKEGYQVWKVEQPASMWTPTRDLFNCIDLVAIRSDRSGVLGIQVCGPDIMPHIYKIMDGETKQKIKKGKIVTVVTPPNEYLKTWLEAGNPFFIWSWRMFKRHREVRAFAELHQTQFSLDNGMIVHREIPHNEKENHE